MWDVVGIQLPTYLQSPDLIPVVHFELSVLFHSLQSVAFLNYLLDRSSRVVDMTSILVPPKRTPSGFFLATRSGAAPETPVLKWSKESGWSLPDSSANLWMEWSDNLRNILLGELLSHGNWFSRPPRRDLLEPLFIPWISQEKSKISISCKTPEIPSMEEISGTAVWQLDGLLLTGTSIDPVFSVSSIVPDPIQDQDCISLFGDETDRENENEIGEMLQEININELDAKSGNGSEPFQIRTRDWETRRLLAKERVREARMKAQIAQQIAKKEESRYYRNYGDAESEFSEFELSDTDSEMDEDAVEQNNFH